MKRSTQKFLKKRLGIAVILIGCAALVILSVITVNLFRSSAKNSPLLSELSTSTTSLQKSDSVPALPLTEVFVNEAYKYSIRYPSELMVEGTTKDKNMSFLSKVNGHEMLKLSIITLADEQKELEAAFKGVMLPARLQQNILDAWRRGEQFRVPDEYYTPSFSAFLALSKDDPLNALHEFAFGVSVEYAGFRKDTYIRLQDGWVLKIHEPGDYSPGQPINEETVRKVIESLNPFLVPSSSNS